MALVLPRAVFDQVQVVAARRSLPVEAVLGFVEVLGGGARVAQRSQPPVAFLDRVEALEGHQNIDDRLGAQAGDRCTADVLDLDRVIAQDHRQPDALVFEQKRPRGAVGHHGYRVFRLGGAHRRPPHSSLL